MSQPVHTAADEERLKRVQKQADDITNITRNNINLTIEREVQLDNLEEKSATLEDQSKKFHSGAVKLRQKYCFAAYRMAFLIFILLAIIIIILYFSIKSKTG